MKRPTGAASPASASGRPRALELQIHPANRRRRVRTYTLGRAALATAAFFALAYLAFVATALGMAPGVERGLSGSQEYPAMAAERMRLGERLQGLVRQLEAEERRGQTAVLDLRRIEIAYGLPEPPLAAARRPPTGGSAASAVSAAFDRESIYADAMREGERLRGVEAERFGRLERMLGAVQLVERSDPQRVRETPAASPLRGRDVVLAASFSRRRNPFTRELAFHAGVDLAAPAGTPVRAPAAGRVAFAGHFSPAQARGWWRLGNLVILLHGDRFATVFGHCGELVVKAGQTVRQGEVVAKVGASGWAASPQLHYEVRRRDPAGGERPVDPRLYILDRHWPNEEQLVGGVPGPRPGEYDPLPVPLGGRR